MRNAEFVRDAGAAFIIPQSVLTEERLVEILTGLENNRPQLLQMAKEARDLAKPEAAKTVAEYIQSVM